MAVQEGGGSSRQNDNDYRLRARITPATSASVRRAMTAGAASAARQKMVTNARKRAMSGGAAPAIKVSRKPVVKPRVSVSPQNLVANAHRAGANAIVNARIPKVGLAGQVGSALAGAGRTLDRRFRGSKSSSSGGSSSPRRTTGPTGLKKYPGGDTPGGAIGRAHQSFFDIGSFFQNLGKR